MNMHDRNTTSVVGEIILYQPDEHVRLEVMVEDETVWLTQMQMVELFQTTKQNVSLHINNAFSEGELEKESVVKEYLTTANDGKNYHTKHYNLDVIISVGYRVKSLRGVSFRRWAKEILKEYMFKGFVINKRIERVESLAIETKQDVTEIKIKLEFLTHYIESVLSDNNEINEDTRMQLELISEELANLQTNKIWIDKPQNPMLN